MLKYSPTHEWVRIEGNEATIGITTYAGKELGDVVYVELPPLGKSYSVGEEIVVLESTKAAADIYAPVAGEVFEVNLSLKNDISPLNQDPEGKGWLFKMKLVLEECEPSLLLERSQYEEMIQR